MNTNDNEDIRDFPETTDSPDSRSAEYSPENRPQRPAPPETQISSKPKKKKSYHTPQSKGRDDIDDIIRALTPMGLGFLGTVVVVSSVIAGAAPTVITSLSGIATGAFGAAAGLAQGESRKRKQTINAENIENFDSDEDD